MIVQYLLPTQGDIGVFYSFEDSFRANIHQTVVQNLVRNLRHSAIVQVHLNQRLVRWNVLNSKNKDIRDPNNVCHLLTLYLDHETLLIHIILDAVLPKLSDRNKVNK